MYNPSYDTTIDTFTIKCKSNTSHRSGIDWDYPLDDEPKEMLQKIEEALANGKDVYVSNYGGMPRIWCKVISLCMASCWPYWTPRPTVIVEGSLGGAEWYDWLSLTGVKYGT